MFRRWILPALALVGVACSVVMLTRGAPATSVAAPFAEPAAAPYRAYVAATGLIQPVASNIEVASPVSGIVESVEVEPGQHLRRGHVLFRLQSRAKRAELALQQAELQAERLRLSKLNRGVRPEEVATQEAQVAQAAAALEEAQKLLRLREAVGDPRAVSRDELLQQSGTVRLREQELRLAQSRLALLRAGTWAPDVEIAQAHAERASLAVQRLQAELDQLTVRAPSDGEVLQVNIRPGESVNAARAEAPPVLMGETRRLAIRTEVDENEAWRVEQGARATAFPRGRKDLPVALRFLRIEPYVEGKRNLTGDSTERVDTRVLPVLFEMDAAPLKLYVGQQLDVYIEAKPLQEPRRAGGQG